MLIIHDEKIANRVRGIAEREQRPIEQVVEEMVTRYESDVEKAEPVSDSMNRVHALVYRTAREYWENEGNTERLKLTLEQVVEKVAFFAEDGKPLFYDEVSPEELNTSLGHLAEHHAGNSGIPDLPERSREIIREELGQESYERWHNKQF
jgi:hypothetical protein